MPTPLVGLVGFLLLGVASLLPGRRARLAQVGLATIASLAGAVLLAAQWAIGHYCPYCSVADASAIVTAFVAWWRFAATAEEAPPRALVAAGAASMLAAALAPVGIGWWLGGRTPAVIRTEMARSPAGQVTVVDFVDFECPFCRMTHAELEPLIEAHRDRLRLVRRQVPLKMHPHALDAARAACCGDSLGKGEAMANALFSAPVEELTPEGCERIAQSVGLLPEPYRACVADPATDRRIDDDRAEFRAARGFALPTLWIDGQELVGAQSGPALEKVIQDALARASTGSSIPRLHRRERFTGRRVL